MLIRHLGYTPEVDPTAYIAPTAVLVGRVKVGPRARVLFGSVLNAEESWITVGESAIISENAVLRANATEGEEFPVIVEDHVFIGPLASLVGCRVMACAYVATRATVMQGAVIRPGALVTVGAVVHVETVVPHDLFIPPNTIAIGDPPVVYSPDEKVTLSGIIKHTRFGKALIGFEAKPEARLASYRAATEDRSKRFESHFEDTVIDQSPFEPRPERAPRRRKAG
jgi:carbonic anhydrase/acetyltransferase-like protein (isoleucine patch superfamily)